MPTGSQPTFQDGWYAEEHDGVHPFRWVGRTASCRLACPAGAISWLRITAGHGRAGERPVLSVAVNGRPLGGRALSGPFSRCLFPLDVAGDLDITLTVDRTFTPPGDPRELGVMIRAVEIVDAGDGESPIDGDGWNDWEYHEYFPFRWMGTEARVLLPAALVARGRFAALPVCCDVADGSQVLTLVADGEVLAEVPLLNGWHVYDVELPRRAELRRAEQAPPRQEPPAPVSGAELARPAMPEGTPGRPIDLVLRANKLLPQAFHPDDARDLSVRVGPLEVHDDGRRHRRVQMFCEAAGQPAPLGAGRVIEAKAEGVNRDATLARQFNAQDAYRPEDGEGWHAWEFQDHIPFRWMGRESRLVVPEAVRRGRRFVVVPIFSDYGDLSQTLTLSAAGQANSVALAQKWNYYSLPLPDTSGAMLDLTFTLNKPMPASCRPESETRELGVRVGPFVFHDDEQRHERMTFFYDNVVLNQREQEAGATTLSSFPLSLGIDLFGKCNIKPACVYCLWDGTKEAEGDNVNLVVDDRTLAEYGPFFQAARSLINCSFGEPLLHPRFGEVLEFTAGNEKLLELSSNGQAFTPATVAALAGKPVLLYVSLDAASPEIYARLRNDRWYEIVMGLTFLREARRRSHGLPKLNMVFMPMRANLGEVETFVKLCRMVEADQLVLRPLNYLENVHIQNDRGGYHFDYAKELLSLEEQREVALQCAEYAEQYGVHMVNQFEFGMSKPAKKRWSFRGAGRDGR